MSSENFGARGLSEIYQVVMEAQNLCAAFRGLHNHAISQCSHHKAPQQMNYQYDNQQNSLRCQGNDHHSDGNKLDKQ